MQESCAKETSQVQKAMVPMGQVMAFPPINLTTSYQV